jgi:HEPN domain-containing protein
VERKDLQTLSKIRLIEAKALLRLGHHDGAYYLAGYAVECALKACIAKGTKRHEFPDRKRVNDSHTQVLKDLVKLASLEDLHLDRLRTDRAFRDNWEVVQVWSEQGRYRRSEPEDAQALLKAASGVMAWIKLHW